jgi:signal transduction histidine kinase
MHPFGTAVAAESSSMTDDGKVMGVRGSRGRARITDVVLVLGLLVVSLAHDFADGGVGRSGWAWFFDIALVLPLLLRRRWPLWTFLVISLLALIQWTANIQVGADLVVLLAVYSVGAYEHRRWTLALAAGVCEIGVVLLALRWVPSGHVTGSVLLLTGTVTAAWILGVNVRTRRAYLASVLERAATAERDVDQQAKLATATERARISREMHDIVAHSLSVMIALSDGAAAAVTGSPDEARTAMNEASTLGRQALGEVRRLLGTLHEADDDVQLTPAPGIAQLDELAGRVRGAGLAVDLVIVGRPLPLPPAAQLTIYRMVQEALTNVLKHARGATLATVTLRYGRNQVDIEIENDDQPIVPTARPAGPAPSSAGHGLAGMRERASVFAGDVDAARRPDGGWRVFSRLQFDQAAIGR